MLRPVIAAVMFALAVSTAGADDKVEPKSNAKIKKLQVELRDRLKKALTSREKEFEAGRCATESLLEVSEKLLRAELGVATRKEQRIAAHAAHLKVARATEEMTTARYDAGRATSADKDLAIAARIEAELGWLKAGGGEEKKDRKDK